MKGTKLITILLIIAVLMFAGCSNHTNKPMDTDNTSSSVSNKAELSQEKHDEESEIESSILTTSTPKVTEELISEAETSSTTTVSSSDSKETEETTKPTSEVKIKPTEAKQTETKPTKKEETTVTKPPVETTEPETEPTPELTVQRADRAEVERKVAEYINSYRSSSATVLSGLTQVARYRSQELVSNFAHTDGISACNALQYGEYVDMTLYGMSESDSYYQGYNREAIAKGNWGGTADEIAQRIANGFKNSSSHWKYLGSSEYSYIAVGCTYDEATSMWYCCICVSSKNYGG